MFNEFKIKHLLFLILICIILCIIYNSPGKEELICNEYKNCAVTKTYFWFLPIKTYFKVNENSTLKFENIIILGRHAYYNGKYYLVIDDRNVFKNPVYSNSRKYILYNTRRSYYYKTFNDYINNRNKNFSAFSESSNSAIIFFIIFLTFFLLIIPNVIAEKQSIKNDYIKWANGVLTASVIMFLMFFH